MFSVQLRENTLKAAEEEIKKLTTSTEAKIDKYVFFNIKNMCHMHLNSFRLQTSKMCYTVNVFFS